MWAAIVSVVVGIWIMVAPEMIPLDNPAAKNYNITGPLVVTMAVIAIWEVNRSARFFNLLARIRDGSFL